jgi:hypothetical protein
MNKSHPPHYAYPGQGHPAHPGYPPPVHPGHPPLPPAKGSSGWLKTAGLVFAVALAAGGGAFGYYWYDQNRSPAADEATLGSENIYEEIVIDIDDAYEAVFLTNGNVYFGNITQTTSGEVVLKDVFYLEDSAAADATEGADGEVPALTLTKLGNELHGPEDEMIINREHVLFIERMKEDSQVVTSINQYKETQ